MSKFEKWYRVDSVKYDDFQCIFEVDGFDRAHYIMVFDSSIHNTLAIVYHNEGEPPSSDYYWGVYCSNGDGCCSAKLAEAMREAETMIKSNART
jgi:hypothetical protein